MKLVKIGITATAAMALSAGLTACSTTDDYASDEGSAAQVSMVNTTCPFTGEDIDATMTVAYKGETVGFCCGNCMDKWDELSDEEKAEKLASAK